MSNQSRNVQVGAFVLNNDATYPWTVNVHTPSPKGGKLKTKFKAEFKHVTPERRLEILEEFREQLRKREQVAEDGAAGDDDVQQIKDVMSFERMLLQEVLIGFSGIKTPDGSDLANTPENIGLVLSNSWARDALLQAYNVSLQGRSAEGN